MFTTFKKLPTKDFEYNIWSFHVLMLSNNQKSRNDQNSQEANDIFQQVKDYLHKCGSTSIFTKTEEGFLRLIHYISKFMKKKLITFSDFRSIGLVLFNDRILINHYIFSSFIRWEENVLFQIISSPDFFCQSLTRSQFVILANSKYIEGCIFDWRVLKYPDCELTQNIIDNIIPAKGESFYLVSNHAQKMLNNAKPNFKLKVFDIIDTPPNQNGWPNIQDSKLEDIFLRYAEDEFSSGKCWLLYKNENVT